MSKDLTSILAGWPFEQQQFNVRIVAGDDGREKIQIRLDLGLIQLEFHGRPDGVRPEGQESYLHHFQGKQKTHDAAHPDGQPFLLEPADCELLLREGMQYYHRYLSFWHLKLYELCARDTKRNLELFAFVREFAKQDSDKLQFDQWRPYVIMMHTQAVSTPLAELRQFDAALQVVESGISRIEEFLQTYQQQHKAQQCFELQRLIRLRDELIHKRDRRIPPPLASGTIDTASLDSAEAETPELPEFPDEGTATAPADQELLGNAPAAGTRPRAAKLGKLDVLSGLQEQLRLAIAAERYEEAARLRDRIADLGNEATS